MKERFRFIAENVVFFIFAYVDTINCLALNLTGPNACPRIQFIRRNSGYQRQLVLECCPDYVNTNGNCQACPSGRYGVNCKEKCFCAHESECDPVTGDCLCTAGCVSIRTYGVNCSEECFCANDAKCDHVTGVCLCPAGWFGDYCTIGCPKGKYGIHCRMICVCPEAEQCDVRTGECIKCNSKSDEVNNLNSGQNINKLKDNVIVYITMVAALIGLVFVVTMVVKVKERLCRNLQQLLNDTSKPKLKCRKAKRSLPLTQTQNAHTGSYIINTEGDMFQSEIEEDLYCEIGDINEVESDRY
ncbi:unnamed protein product [Mytilus edulis]|uniref:EGF-like domain-containing protein n=1 Tax=Mytilus edulis TaxID=6550 RepID=A0A8S3T1F0_MYTED|nr:unnamed protein product [Mytilus edulis]